MGAKIEAIEYYYPAHKLSNNDLAIEFQDYDFDKFERVVGIQNRYIADSETSALDLAVKACRKIFKRHNKESVDFVLYCTQSPEFVLPTTACVLQEKLKLQTTIGALDINLGCSGYTYCLSLAKSLIQNKSASKVLIVTADTYSKYLGTQDRVNRSLFGDAATATLVTYSDTDDIGEFLYGTDGSGADKLILKNKPKANTTADSKSKNNDFLYMDGPAVFDFTQKKIPVFISDVLKKNNQIKVDQYILHQANKMLLELIRKKIKIEKEQFFIDVRDGGNTVSSTIPIALKKYSAAAFKEDSLPKNALLTGFGVGLSWSGGVVTLRHAL
ncbi:MAG: 3-oxoacyl-[acyl-carrier-protein] synthase-3 [Saprospiraceae bacterium]|jgi:3-oxoacyl-[acyl-carrier-protein] synthase-3